MTHGMSSVLVNIGIALALCSLAFARPLAAQVLPDEASISTGETPFVSQRTNDERPFAIVRLPNGSDLEFVQINRGGDHAFGVLEQSLPRTRSAFDAVGDRDPSINPVELFNAVTERGTRIPQRLLQAFGEPTLGPQGWLLGELEPAGAGTDWCDAEQFEDHVKGKNFETTVLRLNKGPSNNDPEWINAFYNFLFPQWGWWITLLNIDLYYTRVAVCGLGNHPAYCNGNHCFWFHPGPVIMFQYQNANNWPHHFGGYAVVEDIDPLFTIGKSYGWIFYTGQNWDWKTSITHAQVGDKFNIGVTWSTLP